MSSECSSTTGSTESLVAIFLQEDSREVVRSVPEDVPHTAIADDVTRAALAAVGSCSDLDWDEWAAELDRIRHESRPSSTIGL